MIWGHPNFRKPPYILYIYGQTPQFARANADDMSEHQKAQCFVGQNALVHDHGFHLATHSLATCALNVTTTYNNNNIQQQQQQQPTTTTTNNNNNIIIINIITIIIIIITIIIIFIFIFPIELKV